MTQTPIIGGLAAGGTTDSIDHVLRIDHTPPSFPVHDNDGSPIACAHFKVTTVYYTRRLFGLTADDGERTTVAFYAPEDWSDERAFYELLDGYSKGLTPTPDSA